MTDCPKEFKFIFRLLTVHRELIIHLIESNGNILIRHLSVWHTPGASFLTGNALIRCWASCLLNVGRVVFLWGELSWDEFSLGRVVLG